MKLRQVLLDIITSMPIKFVDDVLMVSNTLSSITYNTAEINAEAAVKFYFKLFSNNIILNFKTLVYCIKWKSIINESFIKIFCKFTFKCDFPSK